MTLHLLRVERPVLDFERLIAAARLHGHRVGWLELPTEPDPVPPGPLPPSLQTAANFGVLRAVAISGGRSVAVKPIAGQPVLRDVLREHFRGCRLVLVAGAIDAPLAEPCGEDWKITADGSPVPGAAVRWTTDRLVTALAKPHPW